MKKKKQFISFMKKFFVYLICVSFLQYGPSHGILPYLAFFYKCFFVIDCIVFSADTARSLVSYIKRHIAKWHPFSAPSKKREISKEEIKCNIVEKEESKKYHIGESIPYKEEHKNSQNKLRVSQKEELLKERALLESAQKQETEKEKIYTLS